MSSHAGWAMPEGFQVHLDVFDGPFDLLLALIGRHKLDVTEVALSTVTDEFLAHVRALAAQGRADGSGRADELDQTSEFLVVAATLLDLKAARLLPAGDVEDEEDLALLEARDLLFARLLQYRAYKHVAGLLAERMAAEARSRPRIAPLEPALADLLPELVLGVSPSQLALIAAAALTPKPAPVVSTGHVYIPVVDMAEQTELVAAHVHQAGTTTFRVLVADATSTPVVVARFLVLLDLYREGTIAFDQVSPLGELTVRWTRGAAAHA